jgi:hypothetical protein
LQTRKESRRWRRRTKGANHRGGAEDVLPISGDDTMYVASMGVNVNLLWGR